MTNFEFDTTMLRVFFYPKTNFLNFFQILPQHFFILKEIKIERIVQKLNKILLFTLKAFISKTVSETYPESGGFIWWNLSLKSFKSYSLIVLYNILNLQADIINCAVCAKKSQISIDDITVLIKCMDNHYTKNCSKVGIRNQNQKLFFPNFWKKTI